jgi:hypothetical protein
MHRASNQTYSDRLMALSCKEIRPRLNFPERKGDSFAIEQICMDATDLSQCGYGY